METVGPYTQETVPRFSFIRITQSENIRFQILIRSFKSKHFKLSIDIYLMSLCLVFAQFVMRRKLLMET